MDSAPSGDTSSAMDNNVNNTINSVHIKNDAPNNFTGANSNDDANQNQSTSSLIQHQQQSSNSITSQILEGMAVKSSARRNTSAINAPNGDASSFVVGQKKTPAIVAAQKSIVNSSIGSTMAKKTLSQKRLNHKAIAANAKIEAISKIGSPPHTDINVHQLTPTQHAERENYYKRLSTVINKIILSKTKKPMAPVPSAWRKDQQQYNNNNNNNSMYSDDNNHDNLHGGSSNISSASAAPRSSQSLKKERQRMRESGLLAPVTKSQKAKSQEAIAVYAVRNGMTISAANAVFKKHQQANMKRLLISRGFSSTQAKKFMGGNWAPPFPGSTVLPFPPSASSKSAVAARRKQQEQKHQVRSVSKAIVKMRRMIDSTVGSRTASGGGGGVNNNNNNNNSSRRRSGADYDEWENEEEAIGDERYRYTRVHHGGSNNENENNFNNGGYFDASIDNLPRSRTPSPPSSKSMTASSSSVFGGKSSRTAESAFKFNFGGSAGGGGFSANNNDNSDVLGGNTNTNQALQLAVNQLTQTVQQQQHQLTTLQQHVQSLQQVLQQTMITQQQQQDNYRQFVSNYQQQQQAMMLTFTSATNGGGVAFQQSARSQQQHPPIQFPSVFGGGSSASAQGSSNPLDASHQLSTSSSSNNNSTNHNNNGASAFINAAASPTAIASPATTMAKATPTAHPHPSSAFAAGPAAVPPSSNGYRNVPSQNYLSSLASPTNTLSQHYSMVASMQQAMSHQQQQQQQHGLLVGGGTLTPSSGVEANSSKSPVTPTTAAIGLSSAHPPVHPGSSYLPLAAQRLGTSPPAAPTSAVPAPAPSTASAHQQQHVMPSYAPIHQPQQQQLQQPQQPRPLLAAAANITSFFGSSTRSSAQPQMNGYGTVSAPYHRQQQEHHGHQLPVHPYSQQQAHVSVPTPSPRVVATQHGNVNYSSSFVSTSTMHEDEAQHQQQRAVPTTGNSADDPFVVDVTPSSVA